MAATLMDDNRPLKRQKLGRPDIYPQYNKQEEVG